MAPRDLLVASTGGHLTELVELANRFEPSSRDRLWVTFEGLQSESMLADERVVYVPEIGQRELGKALLTMGKALKIIRDFQPDRIISTGAAVATSFLPLGPFFGAESHYIESAARFTGPSVTAKLLTPLPGVSVHAQSTGWRDPRWGNVSSVFDGFRAEEPGLDALAPPSPSVVVTLGTLDRYRFDRLINQLESLLPGDAEILWQVGASSERNLPGTVVQSMPADELEEAIQAADLVVAHAGCGSVLTSLRSGKCPIVVPRREGHGEHVDDHQTDIAAGLASTGLVLAREVDELSAADLWTAAATKITRTIGDPVELKPRGS